MLAFGINSYHYTSGDMLLNIIACNQTKTTL